MKRILLFITATLLLVPGTSCSDDNTGCNPTSDELGILYKDGHDVYGVEVWEETSVILTNYYSLIEDHSRKNSKNPINLVAFSCQRKV